MLDNSLNNFSPLNSKQLKDVLHSVVSIGIISEELLKQLSDEKNNSPILGTSSVEKIISLDAFLSIDYQNAVQEGISSIIQGLLQYPAIFSSISNVLPEIRHLNQLSSYIANVIASMHEQLEKITETTQKKMTLSIIEKLKGTKERIEKISLFLENAKKDYAEKFSHKTEVLSDENSLLAHYLDAMEDESKEKPANIENVSSEVFWLAHYDEVANFFTTTAQKEGSGLSISFGSENITQKPRVVITFDPNLANFDEDSFQSESLKSLLDILPIQQNDVLVKGLECPEYTETMDSYIQVLSWLTNGYGFIFNYNPTVVTEEKNTVQQISKKEQQPDFPPKTFAEFLNLSDNPLIINDTEKRKELFLSFLELLSKVQLKGWEDGSLVDKNINGIIIDKDNQKVIFDLRTKGEEKKGEKFKTQGARRLAHKSFAKGRFGFSKFTSRFLNPFIKDESQKEKASYLVRKGKKNLLAYIDGIAKEFDYSFDVIEGTQDSEKVTLDASKKIIETIQKKEESELPYSSEKFEQYMSEMSMYPLFIEHKNELIELGGFSIDTDKKEIVFSTKIKDSPVEYVRFSKTNMKLHLSEHNYKTFETFLVNEFNNIVAEDQRKKDFYNNQSIFDYIQKSVANYGYKLSLDVDQEDKGKKEKINNSKNLLLSRFPQLEDYIKTINEEEFEKLVLKCEKVINDLKAHSLSFIAMKIHSLKEVKTKEEWITLSNKDQSLELNLNSKRVSRKAGSVRLYTKKKPTLDNYDSHITLATFLTNKIRHIKGFKDLLSKCLGKQIVTSDYSSKDSFHLLSTLAGYADVKIVGNFAQSQSKPKPKIEETVDPKSKTVEPATNSGSNSVDQTKEIGDSEQEKNIKSLLSEYFGTEYVMFYDNTELVRSGAGNEEIRLNLKELKTKKEFPFEPQKMKFVHKKNPQKTLELSQIIKNLCEITGVAFNESDFLTCFESALEKAGRKLYINNTLSYEYLSDTTTNPSSDLIHKINLAIESGATSFLHQEINSYAKKYLDDIKETTKKSLIKHAKDFLQTLEEKPILYKIGDTNSENPMTQYSPDKKTIFIGQRFSKAEFNKLKIKLKKTKTYDVPHFIADFFKEREDFTNFCNYMGVETIKDKTTITEEYFSHIIEIIAIILGKKIFIKFGTFSDNKLLILQSLARKIVGKITDGTSNIQKANQ